MLNKPAESIKGRAAVTNLKLRMWEKRLSGKALAELVGTSQQLINKYENGEVMPRPERIAQLREHVGRTLYFKQPKETL